MSLFGKDYEFIIFSDDFKSLKTLIDLNKFINLNNSNEVEDMFALSQCDSVIMSNSSFRGGALGLESQKVK